MTEPQRPLDDLRMITDLFSEALQAHSAPIHDREFVSLIADRLPSAYVLGALLETNCHDC